MVEIDVTHCWSELELGNRFRRSLRRHLREWLLAEIEERGFPVRETAGFDHGPLDDQVEAMETEIVLRMKAAFRNRARLELADCSPATLAAWLRRALQGELDMQKRAFLDDPACGLEFLIVIASNSSGDVEMEVE
jgi:hypothetical protein